MKHSRLHDLHTKLGATFEEVAGWEMPAHYGKWVAEYQAVRQAVGLSDLSHRGKIRVIGDDRVKWLQGLISNDILPLQPGQGCYSSFLTHKGKMLGYFRVYTLPDSLWVEDVGEVGDATFQALRKFLLYGIKAKMENCAESWGLLLVSGPKACTTVSAAFGVEMSDLKPVTAIAAQIGGHASFVLRTEETGEADLKAVGGHAREALRIEAGLPKAGPDLNEEIVPPEANLEGKAFSLNKGCYPGQEVVARMDTYGNVRRHLVGLVMNGSIIPPRGAKIFSGDREVGWVSSATHSPQLKTSIALAFPLRDFSAPGTSLTIEVDGARHDATVTALPFYRRS
jgi:folate-binding protein YgfZ